MEVPALYHAHSPPLRHWSTLLVLLCLSPAAPAVTLNMMFGHADGEPIVEFESKAPNAPLSGGVTYDLGRALALQLKVQLQFVEFSRRRVEMALLNGDAHIACNTNPAWMDKPERYHWSKPVYAHAETLVSRQQVGKPIREPQDLKGGSLGTILGYRYPDLEPFFQQGSILRRDEPSLDGNFRKLGSGQLTALISTRDEIAAWLRRRPTEQGKFVVSDKDLTTYPTHCLLSPKAPITLEQLDAALDALRKSGQLQQIMSRYQLSPVP